MSAGPLTLEQLKTLFLEGLAYANANATLFVPANEALSAFQTNAVMAAEDLNQFMTAVTIVNGAWRNAFRKPQPHDDAEKVTAVLFGEGHTEWFFISATFNEFAFIFSPMRVEVAPPAVVERYLKNEPERAVVWNLFGGYGLKGSSEWTEFPFSWLQGDYSHGPGSFSLNAQGQGVAMQFSMSGNRTFRFTVRFGEKQLEAEVVAKGPPLPMAPAGCFNCGKYGLSSTYFSYTDCSARAQITEAFSSDADRRIEGTEGHAWIDHQTFAIGQGKNGFMNLVGNSVRVTLGKPLAWLWMYIQDRSDATQYMITTVVDPLKFASGVTYKPICNIYRSHLGQVDLNVKGARVTVGKTLNNGSDFNYPLEYKVTLPSGKRVRLAVAFGYKAVPNFTRIDSWEMPALLLSDTNQEIGSGVVELNGVTPVREQVRRIVENLSPKAVQHLLH
jgi:hypothetical protein